MRVCVFCSSMNDLDAAFIDAARSLGQWIGAQGHVLVWGGCNVGLMNVMGESVQAAGGRTHAIVPRFMQEQSLVFEAADDIEIVESMHARKDRMRCLADGFVALPGGVGTWEEFFEVLALKKLRRIEAPLILMNTRRYYDPLLQQMRHSLNERFSQPDLLGHFDVASSVEEVTAILVEPQGKDRVGAQRSKLPGSQG